MRCSRRLPHQCVAWRSCTSWKLRQMRSSAPLKPLPKALGVTVMGAGVRDAADIESVLSDFARGPNGGLIVTPSPLTATRRDHRHCVATELASDLFVPFLRSKRWVDLIRNRPARNRARSSVLRQSHLAWRESRQFTSTIATKYQLIINLRTAKALGLRPSESFLQRADEVIE